jgi:hypothetical protein
MNKSDIQAINRKVYVVNQSHINYEGGIPLGTYSSLEKAQAAALAYVKEKKGRIYYDINVYEVSVDEQPSDNEIDELIWYWHVKSKQGVFVGGA